MDSSRRFDIIAGVLVFLVILLTVYLTKDFLTTILLSIVLVFLLKPVYALIFRLTRRGHISSLFSLLIVFVIILSVLLGLTTVLLVELSNLERSGAVSSVSFSTISEGLDLRAQNALPDWAYQYVHDTVYRYMMKLRQLDDVPATVASWLFPIAQEQLTALASNLPVLFAQSMVAIFFTYYILIDGKIFVDQAVYMLPSAKKGPVKFFLQELNSIYTTLFTVYFTTSMLSGVLAALGFSMLGIPYPSVLGVITAIFTLLPMLGPPLVFVPLALYYLVIGDVIKSIILLVFGTVVLMIIPENVIRPNLAMKSARIHPIVTVLAYTAPIFVVGVVGVIIGPTLYGFLLAVYRSLVHYKEI